LIAINNWKELVEVRTRLRKMIKRATSDFSFKKMGAAMNSWKQFVSGSDMNSLSDSLEKERKEKAQLQNEIETVKEEMDELIIFRNKVFFRDRAKAVKVSERSERSLRKTRILAMDLAKWLQKATSTTKLTNSIRLARLVRFARASLKMLLASLGAGAQSHSPQPNLPSTDCLG